MSTVVDPHTRKENTVAASTADITPGVQESIDRVREDVARLHAVRDRRAALRPR